MSEAPRIFLSYASVDNEVPHGMNDRQGWVSFFLSSLRYELSQRAVPRDPIWYDRKDIDPAERFEPEIEAALIECELLITVVSPVSVKSEWVLREARSFVECLRRSNRSDAERLFKVIKRRVERDEEPPELSGRTGYQFFEYDPEVATEKHFYHPATGDTPRYWDVLRELADDIVKRLPQEHQAFAETALEDTWQDVPEEATRDDTESPTTVFLARVTRDLSEPYRMLRGELQAQGVRVLPGESEPLPTNIEDATTALESALSEASLAIHLLGSTPGFIPDGGSEGIVSLQLTATAGAAAHGQLHRLLWVSPHSGERDATQQHMIDTLRDGSAIEAGDELVEEGFHQLKALLLDRLEQQRAQADTTPQAQAREPRRVYLLYPQADEVLVGPLDDALYEAGLEVIPPPVCASVQERAAAHARYLRQCDALVIVFASEDDAWVREQLLSAAGWQALERPQPFHTVAVVTLGESERRKARFRSRDADLVVHGENGFDDAALMPLLKRLANEAAERG